MELSCLGFMEGVIFEVVASTIDSEGRVNVAPMGVRAKGNLLETRAFKVSKTYLNLASTLEVVFNITNDPFIFASTALKLDWFKLAFEASKTVRPPRLREAEGYIEARASRLVDGGERVLIECVPTYIETRILNPTAYCRAKPAIIEAVIHATRVREFASRGFKEKVEGCLNTIGLCMDIVRRVASNSVYMTLMEEIRKKAEDWAKTI